MRDLVVGVGLLLALVGRSLDAEASPPSLLWHLEAGGAHAVGDPQAREYRLGGEGRVTGEYRFVPALGVELELGGLWLSGGDPPEDPNIAPHGGGGALLGMAGFRVHPLPYALPGLWADAHLGYVRTGQLDRLGFDADLGYDWQVGHAGWAFGPYAGYLQVTQPDDTLRPQDAHLVSVGLQITFGPPGPDEAAPLLPAEPVATALPPPPPPPLPPDRDHDGIADTDDACPDVPGVPTPDPRTNGCPPSGDGVGVVLDHIEYDDVLLFEKNIAAVSPASLAVVRRLAGFISANAEIEQVDIVGHADERGAEEFNQRLSQARADAVKELLVRDGVAESRLTTTAYGASHPRAQGHSENDWRQNRRVEFIITKVRNAQGGSTSLNPASPGKGAQP